MKFLFACAFLLFFSYQLNAQSIKKKSNNQNSEDLKVEIPKDREVFDPDTLRFEYHAQKTNIKLDSSSNLALFYQTYAWLGVPYRFGGSTRKGIDCSGFTRMLMQSVYNEELPRDSRSMYKMVKPISKTELKEGDLVFFNISRGRISHVGVYLGSNKFIHASTQKGVIISDLREGYYKRYFYKGGRITSEEKILPAKIE